MTSNGDLITIMHDGLKRETDKALLFTIDGADYWFPKEYVDDYDDETLEIPEWLAVDRGVEQYGA